MFYRRFCQASRPVKARSGMAFLLRLERDSSLAGAGEDVRRTGEGRQGGTVQVRCRILVRCLFSFPRFSFLPRQNRMPAGRNFSFSFRRSRFADTSTRPPPPAMRPVRPRSGVARPKVRLFSWLRIRGSVIHKGNLVRLGPIPDKLPHRLVPILIPFLQQAQPAGRIFEVTERALALDGPPKL